MKILILGGTRFVGRKIVEAALTRGHSITLFNRGRGDPGLFPKVERLKGDRSSDLDVLQGRSWDVVVDTSGYMPKDVRAAAEALVGSVAQYIYISTASVYKDWTQSMDETAQVHELSDEDLASAERLDVGEFPDGGSYGKYYGGLKAECERAVQAVMRDRAMIVRPGAITGPDDYCNRFVYWTDRISQGGQVLCPDRPDAPVRYIDARDLADWVILSAERGTAGVYNALGDHSVTFGQYLTACKKVTESDAKLVWVAEEQLLGNDVAPWADMPLWLPGEYNGFFSTKDAKAMQQGLAYRSVEETVRDSLAWLKESAPRFDEPDGLSLEREAELLSALHVA